MKFVNGWITKFESIIQTVFVIIWLSNLGPTDAYFSIYAIIAAISLYLIFSEKNNRDLGCNKIVLPLILSALFSFAVFLANYPLFTTIGDPALIGRSTSIVVNIINSVLSLLGGSFVFYPIFVYVFNQLPVNTNTSYDVKWYHWAAVFASIVIINLCHLFLVEYPGNATEDTFTQISEMAIGVYSNFNTFWHTMIFQSVLSAGYHLFSDLNAAIALFCSLQMILLAALFTYCLMTIHALGAPRWLLIGTYVVYLIIPYNMALSITIWKDVLFAASTLGLLCSWIRIIRNIGKSSLLNYIVFGLSSLLYFLSRTNGWLIYFVAFLFVVVPLRKNKKFLITMGLMAFLGWILLNPMLSFLGISDSDVVESLSIPIQQVSRVIADGCDLTEEEEALVSKVCDLDDIPVLYTSWLSDPMKEQIRSHDITYFENHIDDFRSMWLRLGLRYPWEYVKAWVDQTKGYWNAGYDYFLYSETITDNPYGVVKSGGGNPIASLFRLYFGLSRHVIFFEPLHSIGLHVWIVVLCFVLNLYRRRQEACLCVPLLLLVVGLCCGTPVYSCFRYVYPLFISFPLIVSTSLFVKE